MEKKTYFLIDIGIINGVNMYDLIKSTSWIEAEKMAQKINGEVVNELHPNFLKSIGQLVMDGYPTYCLKPIVGK